MNWNELSLSQKSELFKYYTKAGMTNLSLILEHYNQYAEGGETKKLLGFIDSIKSGIKKFKSISDIYHGSYDARTEDKFQEAYKLARTAGNKTFVWNDSKYNTDYESDYFKNYKKDLESGKVKEFEKVNPGKTYPSLVKAKLEELDTYGITNEYTRDKGTLTKKLKEGIYPRGYRDGLVGNAARVLEAVLGKGDYESNKRDKNDPLDKNRNLAWGMYLGYPQSDNTFSISEYKPQKAELDYYFKYNNYNEEENINFNKKDIDYDKSVVTRYNAHKKKFGNVNNKLLNLYDTAIDRLNFDLNKLGNLQLYDLPLMGSYVRGKTDNYTSYYDKWDINPLGAGNDNSLFEYGTPIHIYDRDYNQHADGGEIKRDSPQGVNGTINKKEEDYFKFMEKLSGYKSKEWKEDPDLILTEMLNDNTYNYKLMYNDNPKMSPSEGHFTDTYKTAYHPTFSNESMYNNKKSLYNPEGITGGTWDYNNRVFKAGKLLDIRQSLEYLNRADPGWKASYKNGGPIDIAKRDATYVSPRQYSLKYKSQELKAIEASPNSESTLVPSYWDLKDNKLLLIPTRRILNTSAGFLSGTDPIGEFLVANATLGKPLLLLGKGASTLLNKGLRDSSNSILKLGESLEDVRPVTLQELYFRLFDDAMHKPLKKAVEYGRDAIVKKTGSDKTRRAINGTWNAYRSGVQLGTLPAYYLGIGASFINRDE